MQTIKKSININASREKIWKVLFDLESLKIWCSIFSEGTYAVTDWKVGGKVMFKDHSGMGIFGRVLENKENELMSLEYDGQVISGVEDLESEAAKKMKGLHEVYMLSEKDGMTHLEVNADMTDEMVEEMAGAWDRAMVKIKEMAETD
jgi:hypothetical protein